MASQDLFQHHLLWFCAFVSSDSLVRVFKLLNVCPAELTGSLGLTFTSSKTFLERCVLGESAAAAEYSPLTAFLQPAPQSGESQHPSILSAFCAVGERRTASAVGLMTRYSVLKFPHCH